MVLENWSRSFSEAFKNAKELYHFLELPLTSAQETVASTYSLFIPRSLAERIKRLGPNSALAKQFLPCELEKDPDLNQAGLLDPIGDRIYSVAPQLIHRYPTRVLFTPTSICPVHCRYCFRKNELNPQDELFQANFTKTLNFLESHSEISELIFTGGDPFTLSTEKLERYIEAFSKIKHLKDVRFHTRYPVILPERFDDDLLGLLKRTSQKFRTVSVAIHANHIEEFTPKIDQIIQQLHGTGVQLLSQTVLLKGVNDSLEALLALYEHFIDLKVRPYYLHHPDRVKGGMHFYTSLSSGRQLYAELRKKLPGWAVPHYILDVPGGHGKIPAFNPETYTFSGQLLGAQGRLVGAQEPDFFI
jgi:lysine 2,3-aminomutase